MATAYLDYLKERETCAAGPFVFTWYESNPTETSDCRLCWSERFGPYLSGIVGEFGWARAAGEASEQLVLLTDRRGKVLLMTGFEDDERAATVMRHAREAGAEVARRPRREDGQPAGGPTTAAFSRDKGE
jgi:hypothetical protein